jgi:hypothetical protein
MQQYAVRMGAQQVAAGEAGADFHQSNVDLVHAGHVAVGTADHRRRLQVRKEVTFQWETDFVVANDLHALVNYKYLLLCEKKKKKQNEKKTKEKNN